MRVQMEQKFRLELLPKMPLNIQRMWVMNGKLPQNYLYNTVSDSQNTIIKVAKRFIISDDLSEFRMLVHRAMNLILRQMTQIKSFKRTAILSQDSMPNWKRVKTVQLRQVIIE